MKKSINIKAYLDKASSLALKLKRYVPVSLFIIVAAGYGLTVWHIKTLSAQEPSEDAIAEKLVQIKRPRIDPNAVKQIKDLQATNVQVQAAFQAARDNPFQDQ